MTENMTQCCIRITPKCTISSAIVHGHIIHISVLIFTFYLQRSHRESFSIERSHNQSYSNNGKQHYLQNWRGTNNIFGCGHARILINRQMKYEDIVNMPAKYTNTANMQLSIQIFSRIYKVREALTSART